jgi:hypothetical protein
MAGINNGLTEANYCMVDVNYWMADGKDGIKKANYILKK